jgi:tetratricopeptide (TPR) repeat protein
METQQQLAQVQVLLDARRYQDAEAKLREILTRTPTHARAHALLSHALYLQDHNLGALQEAQTAVGLAPTDPTGHYVQSLALLQLGRTSQALTAIEEALRLNPEFAPYYATLSQIYVRKKDWKKALAAAEEGLRVDAEHVHCINLRALALVNMGQEDEADQTIEAALARDPENATTHANLGWALLHRGDHQQALTHFREALRLNPMSDWARQGIVEALKARNVVYRLMLRYFLWMSRLTTAEQWGAVAAVSGARRALHVIARQAPILYVIVLPLSLVYFFFAVLTWTARPLFALLLRFDRFGRLALPREEIVASNWVGACLSVSLGNLILGPALGLVLGLTAGFERAAFPLLAFLVLALAALAMIVPIAGVFRCAAGGGRVVLAVYTVLLGLTGLAASALPLFGAWGAAAAVVPATLFLVGWTSYTWIASLVITVVHR